MTLQIPFNTLLENTLAFNQNLVLSLQGLNDKKNQLEKEDATLNRNRSITNQEWWKLNEQLEKKKEETEEITQKIIAAYQKSAAFKRDIEQVEKKIKNISSVTTGIQNKLDIIASFAKLLTVIKSIQSSDPALFEKSLAFIGDYFSQETARDREKVLANFYRYSQKTIFLQSLKVALASCLLGALIGTFACTLIVGGGFLMTSAVIGICMVAGAITGFSSTYQTAPLTKFSKQMHQAQENNKTTFNLLMSRSDESAAGLLFFAEPEHNSPTLSTKNQYSSPTNYPEPQASPC